MCNHRVLNPGLPAAQFDSFDKDASDPIRDEHSCYLCLFWLCVCQTAVSDYLQRVALNCWLGPEPAQSQLCSQLQVSHMG